MGFVQRIWANVNYTDALVDRKNRVLLEWSAKSGCSVGSMMFFRHMGLLEEAKNQSKWIHDYRINTFYPKHGLATYGDMLDPGFIKLKIVRNPFDRAVSSYIHTMLFSNAEISSITGEQRPDMTFCEFLRFLLTLDISKCNPHYRSQFRPYEADGVVFDHILHIERFSEDVAKVNELTGLSFDVKGLSSRHHVNSRGVSSPGAFNMKWSLLWPIPSYPSFYNSETERLVARLYEKDFLLYGYQMNRAETGIGPPSSVAPNSQSAFARRLNLAKYQGRDILRYAAIPFRKRADYSEEIVS